MEGENPNADEPGVEPVYEDPDPPTPDDYPTTTVTPR
jgi:hypothetical protein